MLSETMVFLSRYKSITEQKVVSTPTSKQSDVFELSPSTNNAVERRQTHTEALQTVPNSNLGATWAQNHACSFMHKSRCKYSQGTVSYSKQESLPEMCWV